MADDTRRTTVYLDAETLKALKLKAVVMEKSVSYLINEALRQALADDADDLEAFEKRVAEKDLDFEAVVVDMKRRGRI